jgi:hypothetical protein
MGHHPWEKKTSWENFSALTYPQKCVHVATPKVLKDTVYLPTGAADPSAVVACQHVTSDRAIGCLQRESRAASERYTGSKADTRRIYPALTQFQVKACAGRRDDDDQE